MLIGCAASPISRERAKLSHEPSPRQLGFHRQPLALQSPTSASSPKYPVTSAASLSSANLLLGIAAGDVLIYGKAGIGMATLDSFLSFRSYSSNLYNDFSDSAVATGIALGGGGEYALTQNVSLFGEYQHMRLGNAKVEDEVAGNGENNI